MHLLVDPVTGADMTRADTERILASPLRTKVGADALTLNLGALPGGDLSRVIGAGSVSRDADRALHAAAAFDLDRELAWGTTLVRPYATLTGGGLTGRCYLGAFACATPTRRVGQPFAVTAFDRLQLLDRYLPDTRSVAAGTAYRTAILDTFTAAGIDTATVLLETTGLYAADGATLKTLPSARSWPLLPGDAGEQGGYTWLNVINALLKAVGYRALWTDEQGRFRAGPYLTPASRAVEWSHVASVEQRRKVLLGAQRELTADTWALPNQWTGYQRNPASGVAPLSFTRTDAAGVARRGGGALGLWPAQPIGLDAADLASLTAQVNEIADSDLLTAASMVTTTTPFPIAGHADVYALTDPELGVLGRVQANSWTQAWSERGLLADTQHGWQVVAA